MSETTQPAAPGLRLQFAHQDYQHRAVQAVVQAFDGQPLSDDGFRLHGAASVDYAADGSIANRLLIAEAQML